MADGDMMIYDDYEEVVKGFSKFSLTPCWCRTLAMVMDGHEIPDLLSPDWDGLMSDVCGQAPGDLPVLRRRGRVLDPHGLRQRDHPGGGAGVPQAQP